jgi:hypothetical protein
MRELPPESIEELVQDSVFHPSPCKRHRERVLRSAVQATVRQRISRRTMLGLSAGVLVFVMGLFVVRLVTSPGDAAAPPAAPASAPQNDDSSAPPVAQPVSPSHYSANSLGEDLYRSADPSHLAGARGGL